MINFSKHLASIDDRNFLTIPVVLPIDRLVDTNQSTVYRMLSVRLRLTGILAFSLIARPFYLVLNGWEDFETCDANRVANSAC